MEIEELIDISHELAMLIFCPVCGSEGNFDDHVDTDFGEAFLHICENDECGKSYYVPNMRNMTDQQLRELCARICKEQ